MWDATTAERLISGAFEPSAASYSPQINVIPQTLSMSSVGLDTGGKAEVVLECRGSVRNIGTLNDDATEVLIHIVTVWSVLENGNDTRSPASRDFPGSGNARTFAWIMFEAVRRCLDYELAISARFVLVAVARQELVLAPDSSWRRSIACTSNKDSAWETPSTAGPSSVRRRTTANERKTGERGRSDREP